ncbi:hypothetical protein HV436_01450 [Bacillus sporothermodurans]|uniref:hypothetical protein n=1 Tax=Heyndrickxia sporothermodurans TaxID=46224 RepID=UPI00192B73D5|nr:hypothetical protein [Heyndrickxia sporothermodurans]MBL5777000.1 hypothetical protein [Heyndrickxia sporothermodurans]MBL5798528.1 hypothetical protein [Heyndrickxia sporothermodurans]MBL5809446.1 hypothetical protein [Heyndrickxia sporothermodurans]MBL5813080.1 hypothetical protein [Heyndrickxia sporothermodurans]MBL5816504.1 hypothetical protein [Heyndrickxia sporothermodurans]
MARNKVEYHIQEGAFHTFKVKAGQTIKIGQPVVVSGDMTVSLAGAGTEAIGIVYSGTVGLDGVNDGYKGDNGDVVTVIVLKPIVYLTAGGAVTAGDNVEVGAGGKFIKQATGAKVAKALTGASGDGVAFTAILS